MDRLTQLRGDAGASRDSTLDTSSLPGDAYTTANEGSKYFSLSEVDTSSSDSPHKTAPSDVTEDSTVTVSEVIISDLSPIPKKSDLDGFKIGERIEAANILSGGVNIFDDNENSYDEDELVIDDAVPETGDKQSESKLAAENPFEKPGQLVDNSLEDAETASPSKDTEVVLQIDGKNVDAIDIGNGLYLYRKDGEEELAAVQILDNSEQQPDIKFLKVRENAEGNLEVYEEIEIEVPKEVPTKEGKIVKNASHIPVKDVKNVSESTSNKVVEKKSQLVPKDSTASEVELGLNKDSDTQVESKTEVNLNGKMMKFSESRKSPLIGTFTPMTYHSTPNKEGIPLTKTMVDLQLHPNRHSESVKKTIEVHTDNCKQRILETPTKNSKDLNDHSKCSEIMLSVKDKLNDPTLKEGKQRDLEIDKCHKSPKIENMPGENMAVSTNDEKKTNRLISQNEQQKSLETEPLTNIENEKTEISVIQKASQSIKPVACLEDEVLKAIDGKEKDTEYKEFKHKTTTNEIGIVNNDKDANKIQANDVGPKEDEKFEKECIKPTDIKLKHISMEDNNTIIRKGNREKGNTKTIDNVNVDKNTNDINLISLADNTEASKVLDNVERKLTEINEQTKIMKKSHIDSEMEVIDNAKLNENKLTKSSESLPDCGEFSKPPKNQVDKPLEVTDTSAKVVNDKHIVLAKNQSLEMHQGNSHDEKGTPETLLEKSEIPVKILPSDSDKQMEIKRESKSLNVESTKNLSNLPKAVEIKSEILVKPQEVHVNKSSTLPSERKVKNATDFKESPNESEVNTVFNYNECKPSQNLTTTCDPNLGNNASEPKNKEATKFIVTNVDVKLNHPENSNFSRSSSDSLKLSPNVDQKSLQKGLVTGEQNVTPNSPIGNIITEVAEMQSKTETIQKMPVLQENLKNPIRTSDLKTSNFQNSVELTKKEPAKVSKINIPKPINNNKPAVPFGKWTEANRQEFLNKIKETKVPASTSNTKQLKQPNDLNRRDVLQKIDSQRLSNIAIAKVQELNALNKIKPINQTLAFGSKVTVSQKEKSKDKVPPHSKVEENVSKIQVESKIGHDKKVDKQPLQSVNPVSMSSTSLNSKKDPVHRKEINNQDLIDKTIEGIINRAVTAKLGQDDLKQSEESVEKPNNANSYTPVSLHEIESKMNELHGIPFVERPPHELPQVFEHENKSADIPELSVASKSSVNPNHTFTNKPQQKNDEATKQPFSQPNVESDEEIIEHEPITGDMELNNDKMNTQVSISTKVSTESKKEPFITEKDFDKFARRNSITYENCLKVNFDGKEHHNVIQAVVEKEVVPKKLSRNEIMLAESKAKSNKHLAMRHAHFQSKIPTTVKATMDDDSSRRNYQTKVQIAYQSALAAKRQQECPITIIEDKPVKVVFMDSNHEFTPCHLNVQGKELSPPKKTIEWDNFTHSNSESLDSDILDAGYDSKSQDDIKFKSKHQRKQVLTPVEAPEIELIEPRDLGIEVSPKKKRKIEDNRTEKNSKTLVPKKSYLLNRNIMGDNNESKPQEIINNTTLNDQPLNHQDRFVKHTDAISAIDNLVKAAELIENQSEINHVLSPSDQSSSTNSITPVKRGRGRPRKYPLPEVGSESKCLSPVTTPTPQKKPRLIDAKVRKHETDSDDDDVDSNGELIKENWTMGKINENIVCPICNKLFRSENVVFKHVKHCTGPSPSRSDSDKRSPRRMRQSQELDWKSEGSKSDSMDIDYEVNAPTKKRKSKEKRSSVDDKTDVIILEDTPIKEDSSISKRDKLKQDQNKTMMKTKIQNKISSLVCEICGKTFRQLSYLVNHKLQHKNTDSEKIEKDHMHTSLFSCEICKKEFRKLHHLVQHRIIHNPHVMSSRSSRKSSCEHSDGKTIKDASKSNDDQSAGFRCEPCDKSFRKLHHLVEHRETHDEINKKIIPAATNVLDATKSNPLHPCDLCKKTFRKLELLMEHKEYHLDTSSEKSDDKSVKSSLSTRDIIHECPLCYMVFPNEHSLTKHTIICQRKKKQSAAKQAKQKSESNIKIEDDEKVKDTDLNVVNTAVEKKPDTDTIAVADEIPAVANKQETTKELEKVIEKEQKKEEEHKTRIQSENADITAIKAHIPEKENMSAQKKDVSERNIDKFKSKKLTATAEVIVIPDTPTPKKKLKAKDKIGATVTKRQKMSTKTAVLPVKETAKTPESSDDDEIRYMINPDFQIDEANEQKVFMKVRAKKRSSLQIERPSSKDLMKRRISLQHPPKIPRLKVKPVPRKSINANTPVKSSRSVSVAADAVASTDSDDSDVKYSFPESVKKEMAKKEAQMKVKRQTVVEKRKSLSNIAKRKSLGKTISAKPKAKPSPAKQIKKRTTEAEHRCDCGQLFSSAALLWRHTSLAHTPPRVRRRRSPPPQEHDKHDLKKSIKTESAPVPKKTGGVATRKSSVTPASGDASNTDPMRKSGVATRKSSVTVAADVPTPRSASVVKTRRSAPHRGVPVPEKMRKLMDKSKK